MAAMSDPGQRHKVLLMLLLGWNLVLTLAWLAGRPAVADVQSCAGLTREVAQLRDALAAKTSMVRFLAARLHGVALGNIREAEKALAGTGLKIDMLIRKGRESGAGGPFVPVPDGLHEDIDRWGALDRALKVLPLASPLKEYRISSAYGVRRDPINRRRAMHDGMDLLAPMRTPVLATAPGKVVFAGRRAGYGRLVEIDHGLGVRTRYGHLARITVRRGQAVILGQRVGCWEIPAVPPARICITKSGSGAGRAIPGHS